MKADNLENVIGAAALRLADAAQQAVDQYTQEAGVTAQALLLIDLEPGLRIDQLRRGLGLSHPGTVRLIDRLCGRSLVLRSTDPSDGRAVNLRLSESGRQEVRAMQLARRRALRGCLAGLSPEERRTLGAVCYKLLTTAIQSDDEALRTCRLCTGSSCQDCPVARALGIED